MLKKDIYKDDVIVQSLDVPLFPELQNFKCLNKIYKINQTPDNVIIYFAQNKIIFNYIYYFLVLISALIYSRYKSKKFLYISFILVLNFYVLLVATFIFIDILYFAFFLLIFPLLAHIEYKNLFDSKYSFHNYFAFRTHSPVKIFIQRGYRLGHLNFFDYGSRYK